MPEACSGAAGRRRQSRVDRTLVMHCGLIARPDTLIIRDEKGHVAWELESYKAGGASEFVGLFGDFAFWFNVVTA